MPRIIAVLVPGLVLAACSSNSGPLGTSGASSAGSSGTAGSTGSTGSSGGVGTTGIATGSSSADSTTSGPSSSASGGGSSSTGGTSGNSGTTIGGGTTGTGVGTGTGTSGTAGSGGIAGSINITYTTIDVHPAAKAWAWDAGWPIPDIADGGYALALEGISITFSGGKLGPQVSQIGAPAAIASTSGPLAFSISSITLATDAALGVEASIQPVSALAIGDAGLPQATCAQFAALGAAVQAAVDAGASVSDLLADAGFVDYLLPSNTLLGQTDVAPFQDVAYAVAYAVPMSYAVLLNCAGNTAKATRDSDEGVALVFVSDGGGAQGNPLEGVSIALSGAGTTPSPTYYADGYTAIDGGATDATGVATLLDVTAGSTSFGHLTSADDAGTTYNKPNVFTQPNTYLNVFVYP